MTIYFNHKNEPYFSQILDGRKTIEVRLNKGKYKDLKKNDVLVSQNRDGNEKLSVRITNIVNYKSFGEMLENEDSILINPDAKDKEEVLGGIRRFYDEEAEKEYGVLAIKYELIKTETETRSKRELAKEV